MIVTGGPGEEFQDYRLSAQPEGYDGYPHIGELVVEFQPHKLSAELIAVSAMFAFRPYVSTLALNGAVSPTCARALANYHGDASLTVQPVTIDASAFFEAGHKELVVVAPGLGCPPPAELAADQLMVRIMDRGRSFGTLVDDSEVYLSSNATTLGVYATSRRDRRGLALACGVLLAPSLGCRGIVVLGEHDPDTVALVGSTGLTMRFQQAAGDERLIGTDR